MAFGILGAAGCVRTQNLARFLFLGELSLHGSLRPVKGTLSMAVMGRELGIDNLIVPEAKAREAAVVDGIRAYRLLLGFSVMIGLHFDSSGTLCVE